MIERADVELMVRFLEATAVEAIDSSTRTETLKAQRQVAGGIVWMRGVQLLKTCQLNEAAIELAQRIARGEHP